jgi:hypothetical protein
MDERPIEESVSNGIDPETEDTFPYQKTKRELKKEAKREQNRKALEKERKKVDLAPGLARQPIKTSLGQKQRIQQFKEQLLTDRNGTAIINKIIETALDDDHPNQAACLKMAIDRILPASIFEARKGESKPQVQITISGIGEAVTIGNTIEGEVLDG